jgi:hypothetical protein
VCRAQPEPLRSITNDNDHYVHEDDYMRLYLAAVAVLDAFQTDTTLTPEQRAILAMLERRIAAASRLPLAGDLHGTGEPSG